MEHLVVTINKDGSFWADAKNEWQNLEELGVLGWELVTIAFEDGSRAKAFFKRTRQLHFVKTVAVLQGEEV